MPSAFVSTRRVKLPPRYGLPTTRTVSPGSPLDTLPERTTVPPYVTTVREAWIVSDGSAVSGRTVTEPFAKLDCGSVYENLPVRLNSNVYDCPGASSGERNAPLSATIWWLVLSRLRHVTASPRSIVTASGVKPVCWIRTVASAASDGAA